MIKKILILSVIFFLLSVVATGELNLVKEIKGLSHPESFIYDSASDSYFISNVGSSGGAGERDNDGYITRISGDMKKKIDRWVEGGSDITLNAPKGLAVYNGILYVADIDRLLGFSVKTAKQVVEIKLKNMGAVFLNDVASDDTGNIYVTCTGSGKVFKYSTTKKTTDVWISGGIVPGPNGIVYQSAEKTFTVVDYVDGGIYKFDLTGKKISMKVTGFPSLDGVDYDDKGNLYFSSYTRGKVWMIAGNSAPKLIYEVNSSPADISIDKKHGYLLIPIMMDNSAVILNLTSK